MNFANKHAVVTGGAAGIGQCIVENFLKTGTRVSVIDVNPVLVDNEGQGFASDTRASSLHFFQGDIACRETLEKFVGSLTIPVDFLINNACTSRKGLLSGCTWEDFEYVQRVGVTAPYYLTQQLLSRGLLAQGASIVNIASTRGFQSQPDTESYSAVKGGILALTHSMSVSLAGHARVNAISPGWIDTTGENHSPENHAQHPAGCVGKPQDIAEMVMFLCDNTRAGFITGENIFVDGGMSKQMIYHGDHGWRLCREE